ncbi:M28 family peptidase [Clostridium fallax]|uniref:Peptidase family M28 n=1 Tax=Clostridium fallax TaxID=1533 RepID=A0A1M4VCH2_9CLOT|nr:M28 family peptidase [Clostridium fallax]SHE66659.1 Peptidase family M28 [Clostridium fallax]SQB05783.1 Peptidase family M28 [Clostridium fallax]
MKKIKINYVAAFAVVLILVATTTFGWKNNKNVEVKGDSKIEDKIKSYTLFFSEDIGPRNFNNYDNLTRAEKYLINKFNDLGYEIKVQDFEVDGKLLANVVAYKDEDKNKEKIIVGAHYDSSDSSSADGCSTPIASLLTLAELYNENEGKSGVEFVAFANHEIPLKRSKELGSNHFVEKLKEEGKNIKGAIVLDSLGYYYENILSQRYPFKGPVMPDRGNFIALNGTKNSKEFFEEFTSKFEKDSEVPSLKSQTLTLGRKSSGVESFWENGYDAVLVSDTGVLRNIDIYSKDDNINEINFKYMSEVIKNISEFLSNS